MFSLFQIMYFHEICQNLRLVMLRECSGSLHQLFYKIFQQMWQVRKSFFIQGRVMLKKQHCLFFSNCVNLPCKIEKFELEVVGVVILETGVYFQKETKKRQLPLPCYIEQVLKYYQLFNTNFQSLKCYFFSILLTWVNLTMSID